MRLVSKSESVSLARRSFFVDRMLPSADLLAPTIAESWKRCHDLGLPSTQRPCMEPISGPEMRGLAERDDALTAAAREELATLSHALRDTGHVVLLIDDRGLIVTSGGDIAHGGPILRHARPGINVGEHNFGTTAPGVAFIERRPVAIHRGEHFLSDLQIFECIAAPIMLPNGDAVGTLGISSDTRPLLPGLMALLQNTMVRIERQLMRQLPSRHMVQLHPHPDCIGTSLEGLISLDRNGEVLGLNSLGAQLLGVRQAEAVGKPFEDLLDGGLGRRPINGGQSLSLRARTGMSFFARIETLGGRARSTTRLSPSACVAPAQPEFPAIPEAFTDQELRTLQHLAAGLSNLEISKLLFVSENTVKYHLKNVFSKLHVKSRLQAISVARQQHLIAAL